jgi:predicted Zn-dependent peptidase
MYIEPLDPSSGSMYGSGQTRQLTEAGGMVGLSVDWRLARLANGMRLITIARPDTPTVAVRAYVRAGSRYDAPPNLGLAHFTEHLLFQGTQRRTQREIYASVEQLGGMLDAGTTKEYLTLSAVLPHNGLAAAVSVLAEIMTQPALREDDFWEEKLVVLEEIRRAQDQQSVIFDVFAETLWPVHPLRQPMRGTVEGLHALGPASLLSFYRQRLVTGNTLLAVSGDIGHDEVKRLVAESFGGLGSGPEQPPDPVPKQPLNGQRRAHLEKGVHLTCTLLGVPTVGMKHEDRSAIKVMERVLGMGGSARLYQRLREQDQLVYSVNTVTAHYEDAGYFAVLTACAPENLDEAQQVILEEWDKLRQRGAATGEVQAAKSNFAGTLARRSETNLALATAFGVQELLHEVETFEQAIARINAVQREDVVRVAQRYLDTEQYVAVTVGRAPANVAQEASSP